MIAENRKSVMRFPKKLNARHYQILDLTLMGMPQKEIVVTLRMNQSRVSIVMNSPLFSTELARQRERLFGQNTRKQFEGLLPKAFSVIESILNDRSVAPTVQLRAAQCVFDRVLGKVGRQDIGAQYSLLKTIYRQLESGQSSRVLQDGGEHF